MSLDGLTNLFQAGDDVRDELGGGHGLLDEVEVVVVQAGCVRGNMKRFCISQSPRENHAKIQRDPAIPMDV